MVVVQRVRAQYERYPYPPLGVLALPRAAQVARLAFERGLALAQEESEPAAADGLGHEGIDVLVAGGGTLEPLVVAQAHPRAHGITVVDLSARSVQRARQRVAWARMRRWLPGRRSRLPPMQWAVEDLNVWRGGQFDYIVASNVLHHVADPGALLLRLASWLRPGGLLRMVTYPKFSRLWLRQVGLWLKAYGLDQATPSLKREARRVIALLPVEHPIRLCFESHRESGTDTGIVDAFLHACEQPLSPQQWGQVAAQAGLTLVGEDQHPLSRSDFLDSLVPAASGLDVWSKLEVLDCTLELSTNPVLWFVKRPPAGEGTASPKCVGEGREAPSPLPAPCLDEGPRVLTPRLSAEDIWAHKPNHVLLPSRVHWELGTALRRAARVLAACGVPIETLMQRLRDEVGTHLGATGDRPLPGLAASDYDTGTLLSASEPWDEGEWQTLAALAQGTCSLRVHGDAAPGADLPLQVQWLQCRYGALEPLTELQLVWRPTSPGRKSC